MNEEYTSNLTKDTLKSMFEQNKRFDGRGLTDYRDFTIEYNISDKAEGSAKIKLGKTEVIAGVKLSTGEPYPDSPDKGNLMVSGDLLPLASPRFEQGPPNYQGIELPRLVDRAIRECGLIDLSEFVIEEGKKVWTVIIDIYPINDDGNLLDAAVLAAYCALRKSVFPGLDENGNADYKNRTDKKIPLNEKIIPVSFSFYKLGNSVILDPTREEEEACDTRLTFSISKWNGQFMLNSCQKAGSGMFSSDEISNLMNLISSKSDEINTKLKNYI